MVLEPVALAPEHHADRLARGDLRRHQLRRLLRRRPPAWPGRAPAPSWPARKCSRRSPPRRCRTARPRRARGRRRRRRPQARGLGQPSRGLTRRSRDSPKFAMARAAAPMFSPSCGSTRITTGAGVSIQFLVLSVPEPGMECSSAGKCPPDAAPAEAGRLRQAPAPYPGQNTRRLPPGPPLPTRLLPAECGCYTARAELPSVEFPVGDVRAENNSFEGPRKPFQRARQCSVSGRPKQAGDQRCKHARSRNRVDEGR